MKQAEEDHINLMKQIINLSKIVHDDRQRYDTDLQDRDEEIEALREKIEGVTSPKENLKPTSSDPNDPRPNENVQSSDVSVPGRQQEDFQKAGEPGLRHSDTMKEMRQMIVEMILVRVEVAQMYKEWESMASLAANALAESSILMSGSLMARSHFHRGVALYRLRFYWEATTTFEDAKNYTENKTERVEVEAWLEKARQAQTAAQSALSRQSSVFEPSPIKSRTDSIPVTGAPTALKDELNFDSDFDSIRGFGSRTPSVQSLLASAVESPQERQPRSAERGPEVRDERLRESSLNRRSPGRQLMYSPLRQMPATSRIPSPLIPQHTLINNLASWPNKQSPTPSRMASIGKKPSQGPRGLAEQLARSSSSQGRPPSSPLARRPDNGGVSGNRNRSGSESLLQSAVVRYATTADAQRQSQRRSNAKIDAAAPRRPSALSQEIEQIGLDSEADLNPADEASEVSADHVRNEKRPESREDLQTDLDGLLSDSRFDKGDKSAGKSPLPSNLEHAKQLADRLQPLADQQDESISPGTLPVGETVSDGEFPFRRGDNHTKNYGIHPVQSDHDSQEKVTQGAIEKEVLNKARGEQRDRSGLQAELDRNAEYLANLEKDGEAIPQEALEPDQDSTEQVLTEPEAGTTSDQTSINDLSSDARDQNTTIAEALVEKGGPDDLYDVEDGYAVPSSGTTSGVSSQLTEIEEGSDVENTEWEVVPREANASPPPPKTLNAAEGALSQGLEIDMPQEREQEAKFPLERMDEAEVARKDDAQPPAGRVAEEEPVRQEGATNESQATSEEKKNDEETKQRRQPFESPMSGEGKGKNSKKTKKRKKKRKH